MLIDARTVTGYKLSCTDGEIGHVKEFYFDDHFWAIRYLVADTGFWLAGRQVLISPRALKEVNVEGQTITVNLSKDQLEQSPTLDLDRPVSRQFEEDYYGYFGWAPYWGGPYMWGYSPFIFHRPENSEPPPAAVSAWDSDLRGTDHVRGYNIQAKDGELGHVEDFVIDDSAWAIRYMIVDTRNWWPGKKVLIAPNWIDGISWAEGSVSVNLSRETIKGAPEYHEGSLLTRDYETELHEYYDRQKYWEEQPASKARLI